MKNKRCLVCFLLLLAVLFISRKTYAESAIGTYFYYGSEKYEGNLYLLSGVDIGVRHSNCKIKQ